MASIHQSEESEANANGETRDTTQSNTANQSDPAIDSSKLLEHSWGVEARKEPPRKKQKTDADEEPKGSQSSARGGSGIVGAYVREGREALAAKAPATARDVIDLTADDDEPVITGQTSMAEKDVCYGQLLVKVQANLVPKPSSNAIYVSDNHWPAMKCSLERTGRDKDIIMTVTDPCGNQFGRLEATAAGTLVPLLDTSSLKLRLQARLYERLREQNEWPGQPTSKLMSMRLLIYGPRKSSDPVGRWLGQHNLWLQPPLGVDKGLMIVNPHEKHKVPIAAADAYRSTVHETRTTEEVTNAVTKMFDSLEGSAEKISSMEPRDSIVTPLLEHQKRGLTFMVEKENPRTFGPEDADNSSLWRKELDKKGQIVYKELITGVSSREEPEQVRGGILADVMGLGKTIELLSLITYTQEEAEEFGKSRLTRDTPATQHLLRNAKTTLLVSPLSAVKNWEDQIFEHVKPGTLSVYIHHGPGRTKSPLELAKYDIVITTYGTIASEVSRTAKNKTKLSPLLHLNFFRIALDEAHTIREQKASQTQAVYLLSGSRRWALTGTPVQNRLDDLGSLFRFLRLSPYDEPTRFRQYILAPFKSGDDQILKKLRILVGSCTLRRLKDQIHLPTRQDLTTTLDFSPQEQHLHDFFKSETSFKLSVLAGGKANHETRTSTVYHHVLQAILTLRQISAHGKELLSQKARSRLKGTSAHEAIDLDGGDLAPKGITPAAAFEMLQLLQDADQGVCLGCSKTIDTDNSITSDDEGDGNIASTGYMLPCWDLVCHDCFTPYKGDFDEASGSDVKCPFCSALVLPEYVALNAENMQAFLDATEASKLSPKDKKKRASYEGPSTKARALLTALETNDIESQTLIEKGEPPIKSVVFSEWTSMLDLIEIMLHDNKVPSTRLDGSMSLSQRRLVLDQFNTDDAVTVMLASVKAAGQGLNLTAASRVYIMEPLWNPAAEHQALDRVHRLGQTREVVATRFIMRGSIEEKIVELQRKKMRLANLSLGQDKKLNQREHREATMKDLRDLFK